MVKKIISILLALLALIQISFASFTTDVISTNPSPIIAGDYADITLRFTNVALDENVKNNVLFNIKETKYIKPLKVEDKIISKVFYKESVTKTFRVYFSEDLEAGYINLPIITSVDGVIQEKEVSIYIEDVKSNPELEIGEIKTTPDKLIRDSKNNVLKFTLLNLGEKDAELVRANLIFNSNQIEESFAYSLSDSLSSIESGSEGQFEFTIDLSQEINPGLYDAKLNLSYRTDIGSGNSYEIVSKVLDFKLPVDESPYLIIENIEQLSLFSQGSVDNVIRLTIKNVGEEDADDVRVRLSPDISYPIVLDQTTKYLTSSLKPNESASIEFKAEILDSAEIKTYSSKVILDSLVETTRYTQETKLDMEISQGSQASNSQVGTILIIVVILVSGYIGFNVFRNKNKK